MADESTYQGHPWEPGDKDGGIAMFRVSKFSSSSFKENIPAPFQNQITVKTINNQTYL